MRILLGLSCFFSPPQLRIKLVINEETLKRLSQASLKSKLIIIYNNLLLEKSTILISNSTQSAK